MNTDEDIGKEIEAKRLEEKDRDRAGQERAGSGLLRVFWVFVVTIVLYVLSIGPAWKLQEHGWFKHTGVHAFYGPVEWVVDRSPTLQRFSWWYIHDGWKVRHSL